MTVTYKPHMNRRIIILKNHFFISRNACKIINFQFNYQIDVYFTFHLFREFQLLSFWKKICLNSMMTKKKKKKPKIPT